jgi:hypothetical protein
MKNGDMHKGRGEIVDGNATSPLSCWLYIAHARAGEASS